MFPAETGEASVERLAGVIGLAVLLNVLATGLLGDGCLLRDDLTNVEDSKPLNNDFFFFTGAGDGDVSEAREGDGVAGYAKRSERVPMVNRAEEVVVALLIGG